MEDSSLVARRLCDVRLHLLASPSYLKTHGRPKHPKELNAHIGLSYSYQRAQNAWRFTKKSAGTVMVSPAGPLRVNNGEAMLPSLIAGVGIGVLPEFICGDALKSGQLESLLPDWSLPSGAAHWVTPPMGPKSKRLEVFADYLAAKLGAKNI
jgi:DNA-binding transcriptional LysR family regulator